MIFDIEIVTKPDTIVVLDKLLCIDSCILHGLMFCDDAKHQLTLGLRVEYPDFEQFGVFIRDWCLPCFEKDAILSININASGE